MRVTIEDIDGVQTRYFHHGSGKRGVLMLHGVGVSADSWFWNLEGAGDGVLMVAPDMLGYGLTAEGDYVNGAPHDGIVSHLVALVDHLKLERIVIVGSSFGSNIACHLYWRLQSRVNGLILVGCGPALNGPDAQSELYERSFANGIKAMGDPTLEVCHRRMSNLVFNADEVPEALLLLQLTLYSLPGARDRYERRMLGIKDCQALRRYDVSGRVDEIRVPTVVVWGRQDTRGNLTEAERNAAALPMGEMLIYENCGHLPYLERPDEFNAVVRKMLLSVNFV